MPEVKKASTTATAATESYPQYYENTSNASIIEVLGPSHTREYTVEVTEESTIFKYIELKNADVQHLLDDEIGVRPLHPLVFEHKMEQIQRQMNTIMEEL